MDQWKIEKLTLYQFDFRLKKIGKIVEMFQGSQKGMPATGGSLSTMEKKRLIEMAKLRNVKLPRKGI